MPVVAERRSKQDPPSSVVFDAFVEINDSWWISVEGERAPKVLAAERPGHLTLDSPFLWRPRDVIELSLVALDHGCHVHLRHLSDDPFATLEAAALRHRWGEHIDRDLRDSFDVGARADTYAVSLYRGDVDDWTIVERVLDQSWEVTEPVPVKVRFSGTMGGSHPGWEQALRPHDVLWTVELGRHRTSVGCLPEGPSDLEQRLTTPTARDAPGYRGIEIFVPLPEFGRRLRPITTGPSWSQRGGRPV